MVAKNCEYTGLLYSASVPWNIFEWKASLPQWETALRIVLVISRLKPEKNPWSQNYCTIKKTEHIPSLLGWRNSCVFIMWKFWFHIFLLCEELHREQPSQNSPPFSLENTQNEKKGIQLCRELVPVTLRGCTGCFFLTLTLSRSSGCWGKRQSISCCNQSFNLQSDLLNRNKNETGLG